MADGVHEMSRAVGSLEATVKTLTENWQRNDDEATEGRRRMHEKIDALRSQQESLQKTVEQQTTELAEIKPAIKRFEAQRQRQEIQKSMIKALWLGVVAFATGLGYLAHELLIFFWPPKH